MKNSKKRLLIVIIAMIIIITIIASILLKNIINRNGIGQSNYGATGNSESTLIPDYIKKGITIGGIEGTLEVLDTSDATATEANISDGKTAYVNGVKVTGNGADVNLSYNEGYSAAKESNKLNYISTQYFYDMITNSDTTYGIKQISLSVMKGKYIILTATIRKSIGGNLTGSYMVSCNSGLNIVSRYSAIAYNNWRKFYSNYNIFRIHYIWNNSFGKRSRL